jgi:Spy/CpxP family protein refolding chaperone
MQEVFDEGVKLSQDQEEYIPPDQQESEKAGSEYIKNSQSTVKNLMRSNKFDQLKKESKVVDDQITT